MTYRLLRFVSTVVALAAALTVNADDVRYRIVDLGSLNGNTNGNYPSAINDQGQVTGYAELSVLVWPRPYLYDVRMTDLGSSPDQKGRGLAINNFGHVVGDAEAIASGGYDAFQAFVFASGHMTNLGTLGGINSQAQGINNNGQIVGWSQYALPPVGPSIWPATIDYDQRFHAFLYENGVMRDLHVLAGLSGDNSMATDINNQGQIIGNVDGRGFIYKDGQTTDLGTCGQLRCVPLNINDNGAVVILSEDAGGVGKGFLYEHGTLIDLGSLGGSQTVPRSITNDGLIVGQSALEGLTPIVVNPVATPADGTSNFELDPSVIQPIEGLPIWHAFIRKNGSMIDLNSLIPDDSGWILTDAESINAYGQIVGNGTFNGVSHAFLLTPVPEPRSATLLSVIVAVMMASSRCATLRPR